MFFLICSIVFYLLAQTADGVYTRQNYVRNGGHIGDAIEWNPMARPFIKSNAAMVVYKLLFVVPTLIVVGFAARMSLFWPAFFLCIIGVATGLGAYSNYRKV